MEIIAVDYDCTLTLAPEVFRRIIPILSESIAPVWCISNRSPGGESGILAEFPQLDGCLCVGSQFKGPACEAKGLNVLFSMDDQEEAWWPGEPIWQVRLNGALKWIRSKLPCAR